MRNNVIPVHTVILKRGFDLCLILIMLPFIMPLLIILAILIRIKLGSPIFFKQIRPGYNGVPFLMVKFRTMTEHRNKEGALLPDDKRLTSFGKFLRSTSLDELPELWNVFNGQMSLVGPRPLLLEYLPLYTPEQYRRHMIRPGITGWAQINGRNSISWEEKFKLDVWYVDNCSLWLDVKILFLTIKKVFIREGISAEGSSTIERFKGSQR